jgi:hypothetical protein
MATARPIIGCRGPTACVQLRDEAEGSSCADALHLPIQSARGAHGVRHTVRSTHLPMASPLRSTQSRRRDRLPPEGVNGALLRFLLVAPLGMLFAAVGLLAWGGSHCLAVAEAGREALEPEGLWPWWFAGLCGLGVAIVVSQGLRIAHRLAGPEQRLRLALRRIRSGDLAFRVQLRSGDLLTGLAAECNALLDWLNHNPPGGSRVDGDVVGLVPMPRTVATPPGAPAAAPQPVRDEVPV